MTTTQNQHTPRKPPLPPSAAAVVAAAAAALGARPACASCKRQRQRQLCTVRCPLAAYFPADKQNDFDNVDRLFGIRRVVKILKKVPPRNRQEAVKYFVHEANLRAKKPVGGCCAAVKELSRRINDCEAELKRLWKILLREYCCGITTRKPKNQET